MVKPVFSNEAYKLQDKVKTIRELELPKNKHQHVLKDEIIELTGVQTKLKYQKRLRRLAL